VLPNKKFANKLDNLLLGAYLKNKLECLPTIKQTDTLRAELKKRIGEYKKVKTT
jgi:hypothetical protein